MARQCAAARTRGKSDPIDALAVARAMAREDDLPAAFTDEQAREVKHHLSRREGVVAERTRVIDRLRWHLHELDPEVDPAPRALTHRPAQDRGRELVEASEGIVAEIAGIDRKSTRLNSSHVAISYAVFCLKKKKKGQIRVEIYAKR